MKALLALAAFALTVAEASVGALATRHLIARNVGKAVFWGTLFDALLLADMWFIVEARWLAVPILLGSAVGIWLVVRLKPARLEDGGMGGHPTR